MQIKHYITIFSLLLATSTLCATAENKKNYISIGGGVNRFIHMGDPSLGTSHARKGDSKTRASYGLGIGRQITNDIRLSLDASQNRFENKVNIPRNRGIPIDMQKSDITSLVLNGHIDFQATKTIKLHINAGIGMAVQKTKSFYQRTIFRDYDNIVPYNEKIKKSLAYNVGAGIRIKREKDRYGLDFSYAFKRLGKTKREGPFRSQKFRSQNIMCSVFYQF